MKEKLFVRHFRRATGPAEWGKNDREGRNSCRKSVKIQLKWEKMQEMVRWLRGGKYHRKKASEAPASFLSFLTGGRKIRKKSFVFP